VVRNRRRFHGSIEIGLLFCTPPGTGPDATA